MNRAWGIGLPAATTVHLEARSLPLLAVWSRDPGEGEHAVTEAKILRKVPSLSGSGLNSEPLPIAEHLSPGGGAGLVAAGRYDGRRDRAMVVWEEPGEEEPSLRGAWVRWERRAGVHVKGPLEMGAGRLHPDGKGVACTRSGRRGGWCLVAFESGGEIRGRWFRRSR